MTATVERPNVILITTDQQRFDALGLAKPDGPLQTPTLDAMASAGVWFRRAYSTSPVCIPEKSWKSWAGTHSSLHGRASSLRSRVGLYRDDKPGEPIRGAGREEANWQGTYEV